MMDHREEVRAAFNLRKERFAKILGPKGMVKEAGKPMAGPWYWLYLQPNWILRAYPEPSEETDSVDHIDFWEALVPDIATHYGIKDARVIQQISTLCYGMPRGRVVYRKATNGRVEWVFYHGVDFKYTDAFKKQLIQAYDLSQQARAGFVRFDLDSHENMSREEHVELMSLLNRPSKKNTFDGVNLKKQLNPLVPTEFEEEFVD